MVLLFTCSALVFHGDEIKGSSAVITQEEQFCSCKIIFDLHIAIGNIENKAITIIFFMEHEKWDVFFLGGDIAQSIKYWPGKHDDLSSFHKTYIFKKPSIVTHSGVYQPASLAYLIRSRSVRGLVSKDSGHLWSEDAEK